MQTIKVSTSTTVNNSVVKFMINGVCIAHIGKDGKNTGRYAGRIDHAGVFAGCHNRTFPDAVEFISDAIERHFAAFGLNVEFA